MERIRITISLLIACFIRCVALIWIPFQAGTIVFGAESELSVITSAHAVRELSAESANRAHPVRLRGVVLVFNEKVDGMAVQDESAAIYVDGTANKGYQLQAGQLVEIEGVTSPGDFAPMVVASDIKVIGTGKLPPPRERTFDQLSTGAEDGQWVKVSGIIRSATIETLTNDTRLSLELAMDGGRLTVRVPNVDAADTAGLVDCQATVTGICFPVFNRRRQLLAVRLRAPSLAQFEFKKPEQAVTFESPSRTINSLMQFEPRVAHGHRVKVRGTVTLRKPGAFFFIRDETQGLWVKSTQRTRLEVGDIVEVLGFPAFGDYNPVLEDAMYVRLGTNALPAPPRITIAGALTGDYDAELVQMDAMVLDSVQTGDGWIYMLQEDDLVFRAHLPLQRSIEGQPIIEQGSRVRVTGICLVQAGTQRAPQSFQLLMRSPVDLRVLAKPSWWTLRRAALALGIMTTVFLCAMMWVLTLRRRVLAQTAEIERKIEREAVLEERTRIAREFHDTIEQQLAAVVLQVQAARLQIDRSTDSALEILQLAESMLRHTQSEARHSVWDLRALALENGTLDSALRAVGNYVRNGSPVSINVTVAGNPRPLDSWMENHLLRIAQEAAANAVKHGEPKTIQLGLHYGAEMVTLKIEDDGKGFAVESVSSGRSGHFGLLGMRERAEKIGGKLEVASSPGRGTTIEVSVQFAGETVAKRSTAIA